MKKLSIAVGIFLAVALVLLSIFGDYKIAQDDERYTAKDAYISAYIIPFYSCWVGAKELYRIATTSSENRQLEDKCLHVAEVQVLDRKIRLRFCECIAETRNAEQCQKTIFAK